MAFKIIYVFTLLALANAAVIPEVEVVTETEAPSNYNFGYTVNDPFTGDNKHQEETRAGDVVQGSYSLVEADGTKRIVKYTADADGFNADVQKEPALNLVVSKPAHHVVTAPGVHHVIAAPGVYRVNTPIGNHFVTAPVGQHIATSPLIAARVAPYPYYSGLYSPYYPYTQPLYTPYHHFNNYLF